VPIPEPRLAQSRDVRSKAGRWWPGFGCGLGPSLPVTTARRFCRDNGARLVYTRTTSRYRRHPSIGRPCVQAIGDAPIDPPAARRLKIAVRRKSPNLRPSKKCGCLILRGTRLILGRLESRNGEVEEP
jgi:hypothetical protein